MGIDYQYITMIGFRVPKIEEEDQSWLALKPEYKELSSGDGRLEWTGQLGQAEICFTQIWDMLEHDLYFVGVWVSSFVHRDDLGAQCIDVPKIPSKSAMAKFLRKSGIPFDYESWGLWRLGQQIDCSARWNYRTNGDPIL